MKASPGRTYLRVGVQLLNNFLSPPFYLPCFWVQATVKVHAAEVVLRGEDEAYAAVAMFCVSVDGFLIAGPGLRVGALGLLACEWGVRDLGRLAVAFLDAPTLPLSEVSY